MKRWIGWAAAVALCGCSNKAQRSDIDVWLAHWSGPQPRVAVVGESNVKFSTLEANLCDKELKPYRMILDPSAPVRAAVSRQAKGDNGDYEDHIKVTTARRGVVYDQPWPGYLAKGCNEALAQALRVFGDENGGAGAAQAAVPAAPAAGATGPAFVTAAPQP